MPGFGEIFEEWERLRSEEARAARRKADAPVPPSATSGRKRAAAPAPGLDSLRARGGAREALQTWLDTHGVEDAGREGPAQAERGLSPREAEALAVDARIDLHGLSVAQAETALQAFFREAAASGARKVLIVHGKGLHSKEGPVLKEATRRFLERCPLAGRSGTASRAQGGGGATWALLRRP